jgi:hypothetical protein
MWNPIELGCQKVGLLRSASQIASLPKVFKVLMGAKVMKSAALLRLITCE